MVRSTPGSPDVHVATALKHYAFGLRLVHDPNWTGLDLYYHIKDHLKGREEPTDLLFRPLDRGLAYHIGLWTWHEYLDVDGPSSHFDSLQPEYKMWYVQDLRDMIVFHDVAASDHPLIEPVTELLDEVEELYGDDEDEYWYRLQELSVRRFTRLAKGLKDGFPSDFESLEPCYASAFGDRVLHDRQLCGYLAELMVAIGFPGAFEDQEPAQWMDRVSPTRRALRILRSRDRGRCALCGADIDREFEAEPHVDHIVPLAKGGCNDLVNLQCLCSTCNLSKGTASLAVATSVPRYIERRREGDES